MFDTEVMAMAMERVGDECREACEQEAQRRGVSPEQVLVEKGVRRLALAARPAPALRVVEGAGRA